eukprot:CAMPEP_0198110304 /NCGR_PEP_ID=MMETSP1442-20131203/2319_1 /TAXON_ID= /ORGANISM="Craspedostauros australis, Strain CCMP3328" /LENGTH=135 /DNA_ID=CAMNT_0043766287 /DNA_START=128 /DNA_END=535 /DNA_ORIENTATION=+
MSSNSTRNPSMMLIVLAIIAMIQSTSAWSIGPFAMSVPIVKPRSTMTAAGTAAGGLPIASAFMPTGVTADLLDSESVVANARMQPTQLPSQLSASGSAVAPEIVVDTTSFTLDDSFRSSTVDMLYHQSMQRAGLE